MISFDYQENTAGETLLLKLYTNFQGLNIFSISNYIQPFPLLVSLVERRQSICQQPLCKPAIHRGTSFTNRDI